MVCAPEARGLPFVLNSHRAVRSGYLSIKMAIKIYKSKVVNWKFRGPKRPLGLGGLETLIKYDFNRPWMNPNNDTISSYICECAGMSSDSLLRLFCKTILKIIG